jgi:D-alanyl-D-alanine carboxypeptidase
MLAMKAVKYLFAAALCAAAVVSGGERAHASSVNVSAQAAIVIDYDTGEILYEKDARTPRVPASLTKIMTAYIVFQELESGRLTLDTVLHVSANASAISRNGTDYGGSYVPLVESSYTVREMLYLLFLPSANAAPVVFAEHISGNEETFVVRMNETAAGLGMYAEYKNAHGAQPHYSDAYSTAILVRRFIQEYPSVLNITKTPSVTIGGRSYTNSNRFLLRNNGHYFAEVDGFKTGSLDGWAGCCLASTATRGGKRIIAVVMNSPDNDARYRDSRKLLEYGFTALGVPAPGAAATPVPSATPAPPSADNGRVVPDGKQVSFEGNARYVNTTVLTPLGFLDALGFTPKKTVNGDDIYIYRNNGDSVMFTLNSSNLVVNGKKITAYPPQLFRTRVYLPAEALARALGMSVYWDRQNWTLTLFSPREGRSPFVK